MLPILGPVKAAAKIELIVHLTLFVSLLLLSFLLASCVSPGLSHMPLVLSPANTTEVRVAYFGVCISGNCSTTAWNHIDEASFGQDLTGNIALRFRDHIIRPYFLILSLCAIVASFFVSAISAIASGKMNLNPVVLSFIILAWAWTIITAVWQEVAVHAAVVFLGAIRGRQASGIVWSAVALLSICVLAKALKRRKVDPFSPERQERPTKFDKV